MAEIKQDKEVLSTGRHLATHRLDTNKLKDDPKSFEVAAFRHSHTTMVTA
jgi:hypothetical protein